MRPVFIREAQVRRLIDPATALRVTRAVFLQMAEGKAVMPPKVYLSLPDGGDFRAMPGYLQTTAGERGTKKWACGMKWVSVFPANPSRKLPTVHATVLLNSARTGQLLAILEANALTARRTAAVSALATRLLCRPRPKRLALVGAGLQAAYQLEALTDLYPFQEIRVWGYHKGEAQAFCQSFTKKRLPLGAAADIPTCVRDADVIVTSTPSRKPIVFRSFVKNGAHINAIGADAKGKEELDPRILKVSKIVVDEWEQASHSGEINVPLSKGLLKSADIHAELKDIVSGKTKGRTSDQDITVFDSTGLALLDIAFAQHLYDRLH